MQTQAERLPCSRTAVWYAFITRDTALFKGMSRATQYGDFLAKAVLYDHMTKKQKASEEAALRRVNEAFVNYNLLPGRTRSCAKSMGLTWFWAFLQPRPHSSLDGKTPDQAYANPLLPVPVAAKSRRKST